MGDVKGEMSDSQALADRLGLRLARLKIPESDPTLQFYKEAFATISDGRAQIFREDVKEILIPCIFLITPVREKEDYIGMSTLMLSILFVARREDLRGN